MYIKASGSFPTADALPYNVYAATSIPHDDSFLMAGGHSLNPDGFKDAVLTFQVRQEIFSTMPDYQGGYVRLAAGRAAVGATLLDPKNHPECN